MNISTLIDSPSELTDCTGPKCAIVLMTRVRLARNLAGRSFPGWADKEERAAIVAAVSTFLAFEEWMKDWDAGTVPS